MSKEIEEKIIIVYSEEGRKQESMILETRLASQQCIYICNK
jgi:hypothetical protein